MLQAVELTIRADGRVATRNYIGILTSVRIPAGAARCAWRAASRMLKMEGGAYAWTADN